MDTSENYTKMCEKAEEIQNRHLIGGDFYAIYRTTNVVKWSDQHHISAGIGTTTKLTHHKRGLAVWLPRQDQLQEILRENAIFSNRVLVAVIDKFRDFVFAGNHLKFETMEQLWLAFVMKSLYSKVWSGEKWAKITR